MAIQSTQIVTRVKGRYPRRLTLCGRPASAERELPCDEGLVLAKELLGYLLNAFRNSHTCSRVTGIALGCQKGFWNSEALGEGTRVQHVGGDSKSLFSELVSISFAKTNKSPSGSPASIEMAELAASVAGILRMVLKQCHQRHELIENEDLYKVILHSISDVAILCNTAGRIAYICPNAEGFCGRSYAEICQIQSVTELLPPESPCLDAMRQGTDIRDIAVTLIAKDGSEKHYLTDVIRTCLTQGPFLFTFRDVSDLTRSRSDLVAANLSLQQNSAELAQKNIALKELLYQVGRECDRIRSDLSIKINEDIVPLIDALEKGGATTLRPIVTTLKKSLWSLIEADSRKNDPGLEILTLREQQISQMVKTGFSSKEIATALHIATATVVNTRKRIRKKLGVPHSVRNLASWKNTSRS